MSSTSKDPAVQKMDFIFELADVADRLKLEKSRIKNWTIGRPFTVKPSLRVSSGKGSRNLFNTRDLYCFALIKHFLELNAPVQAIQEMLASPLVAEDLFWSEQEWLVITRKVNAPFYVTSLQTKSTKLPIEGDANDFIIYAVNLKTLAAELSLTPNYIGTGGSGIAARLLDVTIEVRDKVDRLAEEDRTSTGASRILRTRGSAQNVKHPGGR